MRERLLCLRNIFGFQPSVIYDIGAHEGLWTRDCKEIFPSATYYQFEADTDKKEKLVNGTKSFFEVLGNEDNKEVDYYKVKTQKFKYTTGNSIFPENSYLYTQSENFYIEKRIMKHLDTLVLENNLPFPDFLKLDTQGSELLILEGAAECMKKAKVILLEVSIHEYNKNAPLIADVLAFMKERKFLMFDIIENHIINGVLAQIDILFCKEDSPYLLHSF
jgi:FkbM family methyltransferase